MASGFEVFHRAVEHGNGDLYVAGYSNSFSSDHDFVIARFTNDTDLVWAKVYDLISGDGGLSLNFTVGPSGALYITGTNGGVATNQEDGTLVKLDENGIVLWAKSILPQSYYAQGRAVLEAVNGDVYIAGSANSIGAGNADLLAARFTSNGTLQWLNSYGASGQDHATFINQLTDGSIVVGSQSSSYFGGTRKGLIANIGTSGAVLSAIQHGGGIYDSYNQSCPNGDGTYLRVGYTETFGAGSEDVLAVLTDSIGNVIWSRSYGTAAAEYGMNAIQDGIGGWFIACYNSVPRQAFVAHIDGAGTLLEVNKVNNLFLDFSSSWCEPLIRSNDGGMLFCGSVGSSSSGDAAIVKLNACGVSTCNSESVTWVQTDFVIPQQSILFSISATSTNVIDITATVTDITTVFDSLNAQEDCPDCAVALDHPDMSVCLGDSLAIQFPIDPLLGVGWVWQWDLGDGAIMNTPVGIEHLYATDGIYPVQVIATDTAGSCGDTLNLTVNVILNPVPSLGPDTTICAGSVLDLSSAVLSNGSMVIWSTSATTEMISVDQPGLYWIQFENDGCSAADTIVVSTTGIALDLGPDTMLCSGESVLLDLSVTNGVVTWQNTVVADTFLVSQSGTYSVEITEGGCVQQDTITVNFITPAPLDLGPDTTLCSGEQLLFDLNGTGASIIWMDVIQTDTFLVTQAGTYWVESGAVGCSVVDTIIVNFVGTAADLGPDTTLCNGESVLLDLTGTNGVVTWQNTVVADTFLVSQSGTYWVEISEGGCVQQDTITVNFITPAPLDLGPDTTLCSGEQLLFDLSGTGASIIWMDVIQTDTFLITLAGTYWVESVDGNCSTLDTIIVSTVAGMIDLGPDTIVCAGQSLLLDPMPIGGNLTWLDSIQSQTFLVLEEGNYWVQGMIDGCLVYDTISVGTVDVITMDIGPDQVLCDVVMYELDAGPEGSAAVWSNGSTGRYLQITTTGIYWAMITTGCGPVSDTVEVIFAESVPDLDQILICPGERTEIIPFQGFAQIQWSTGDTLPSIFVGEGLYSYEATDQYGCIHSDTVEVYVDIEADGMVFVPNTFTPNDDGLNEVFKAFGADRSEFEMMIFNRWGEEIFTSHDPNNGWNGVVGHNIAPDGTYVYILKYRDHCNSNDTRVVRYGHVTLLR